MRGSMIVFGIVPMGVIRFGDGSVSRSGGTDGTRGGGVGADEQAANSRTAKAVIRLICVVWRRRLGGHLQAAASAAPPLCIKKTPAAFRPAGHVQPPTSLLADG